VTVVLGLRLAVLARTQRPVIAEQCRFAMIPPGDVGGRRHPDFPPPVTANQAFYRCSRSVLGLGRCNV
jgi:hypothetical protein